jgi:hypothetical protein
MNGSSVKTDQMLGGIRDSARFIAEQSRHVRIPPAGIQKASEFLADHFNSVDGERYSADRISEAWHRHRLHPSSQDPVECANHLLLMDLLNFSFFSDNDGDDTSAAAAVEYSVTFGGERYTGYWTLCACLMRGNYYILRLLMISIIHIREQSQG